ncbi:trypsin-like peptidase domain-containing protein [Corynebacterium breve]|uniref:Trypsin-like peptidase domain-containing protein n=1 Tax=Corynebacterium breve TaxID=3049799 RepID=A0ABY8VJL6_9CORY|nr:trypsin-like peptidase domain-containing protein [Corynebacterium breve]WIM68418.1 trypsin-like peptidase domain-containing protein [Corynebacterium breve]
MNTPDNFDSYSSQLGGGTPPRPHSQGSQGENSSQPFSQVGTNPYGAPNPTQPQPQGFADSSVPAEKRKNGAGTAVAVATVISLLAGGGAGYVAGKAGSADATEPFNAINEPSVSGPSEAPSGSVEEVAENVLPAVVSIQIASNAGGAEGSGSIISSDGYVMTNHHVVGEASSGPAVIQVTMNDGSKHEADFVASDVNTDIAVIKIKDVSNLPVLEFGESDDLRVGQEVIAVGSPLGLSATVTSGIVSALNRPVRASQGGGESSLIDAIQTDAAINPGNSGGPLVDMHGNLIGMNSVIASLSASEGSSGSIGLGFAIPANFAKRVADQLINDGEATQPMLGVQVDIRNPDNGALVVGVTEGGPGDQAGLSEGDVITKLNDRLIESADALIAATRSHDFGEKVTLEVHPRDSEETREVEVTLSSE